MDSSMKSIFNIPSWARYPGRRPVFFILSLFVLLSLIDRVTAASYKVNVIIPMTINDTDQPQFQQWASIAKLAATEINADWADELVINVLDNEANNVVNMQHMFDSGQDSSVLAIMGAGIDALSHQGGMLMEQFGMVIISPNTAAVGVDTANPHLLSMRVSDFYPGAIGVSLIQRFNWTRIGVLYADSPTRVESTPTAQALLQIDWSSSSFSIIFYSPLTETALAQLAVAGNISVTPILYSLSTTDFSSQLRRIGKESLNVVFILGNDMLQFSAALHQAKASSMFNAGYAWAAIAPSVTDLNDAPKGTISVAIADADPQAIISFTNKIKALDSATYPGCGPTATLQSNSIQVYDGIYSLVNSIKTIQLASQPVTRATILSTMRQLPYTGVSGFIYLFPETGLRAFGPLNVLNVVDDMGTSEVSIFWDGTELHDISTVIFPGGTTEVPSSDAERLILGFSAALSGPDSVINSSQAIDLMKYMEDLVNNETLAILPSGTKLSILLVDDQNSPAETIQRAIPFAEFGIIGALGSTYNQPSKVLQDVVSAFGIPQISSSATIPSLSDKLNNPTFFRNIPSDIQLANVFLQLCITYNWQEVGLIFSSDSYGSELALSFVSLASEENIQILHQAPLSPTNSNYDNEILALKQSGARVVFSMVSIGLVPEMVRSMNALDYRPPALISASSQFTNDFDFAALAVESNVGISFFEGWIVILPPRAGGNFWNQFVERLATQKQSFPLAWDSVTRNSSYIARTIDAIYIYADALTRVVQSGQSGRNVTALRKELLKTDLNLCTGRTRFDNQGDRIAEYDVLNVRSSSLIPVGTFSRFAAGTPLSISNAIVWPGGSTSAPSSALPRRLTWLDWGNPAAIIFAILASLGMLVTIVVFAVVVGQRNSASIRTSTWQFLIVMLIGICLGYGSIFTWLGRPERWICALRIWLPPMAFILIISPLLAKTWRLHRIFTLGSLKISPVPLWKLILMVVLLILAQIIICIFWISFGTISTSIINDKNDKTEAYLVCGKNRASQISSYVTYGYLGLLMVCGAYIAFRVRNLPKDFNESKWIGFTIYNTLLFSVIIIILGYALSSFPITVLILICVCTFAITTGAICLMMIPKVWDLWRHPEKRSGSGQTDTTRGARSRKLPISKTDTTSYEMQKTSTSQGSVSKKYQDSNYSSYIQRPKPEPELDSDEIPERKKKKRRTNDEQ